MLFQTHYTIMVNCYCIEENTTNPTEETDLQTTHTISDTIQVAEL